MTENGSVTLSDPSSSSPTPDRCPCLSGVSYADCCGRLHLGDARAATAEALMRSRYAAFAVADADYLLRTWHPSTRPETLELDPTLRWVRLDIGRTVRGGPFDTEGSVEFTAHFRQDGQRGEQHEVSRFARIDGSWLYLDALD